MPLARFQFRTKIGEHLFCRARAIGVLVCFFGTLIQELFHIVTDRPGSRETRGQSTSVE